MYGLIENSDATILIIYYEDKELGTKLQSIC